MKFALVLVTDGLESCGGDPVAAARELYDRGIRIHVIGFGLASAKDEDTARDSDLCSFIPCFTMPLTSSTG